MDRNNIEKLANLARLELAEAETTSLASDIESILGYVSEIQKVSAEETKPEMADHYNIVRTDDVSHEPALYTDEILKEAPTREGNYIQVKKIIQND